MVDKPDPVLDENIREATREMPGRRAPLPPGTLPGPPPLAQGDQHLPPPPTEPVSSPREQPPPELTGEPVPPPAERPPEDQPPYVVKPKGPIPPQGNAVENA